MGCNEQGRSRTSAIELKRHKKPRKVGGEDCSVPVWFDVCDG